MEADAEALEALIRRSQAGDTPALTELKKNLSGLVRLDELEALAGQAREVWAGASGGGISRRAARLRALDEATVRLARHGAGPLEMLLAGWVALASARLAEAQNLVERAVGDQAPVAIVRNFHRRVKRAERDETAAARNLRAFQQRVSLEQ